MGELVLLIKDHYSELALLQSQHCLVNLVFSLDRLSTGTKDFLPR